MERKEHEMDQIIIFSLDNLLYALPLSFINRVIHAIEIRTLPKAPQIISGIINVKGRIIPVVDVRKRLGFPSREIDIDDQLIITDTGKREIALMVDSVSDIREISPGQHTDTRTTLPFATYIRGVAKIADELILIYDLEQFLNLEEEAELEQAMSTIGR